MYTDEFTESRGVVVSYSLGVTVSLKDGVTHDHLVFDRHLLGFSLFAPRGTDTSEVLDDFLGVLGFTRTGFSSNQDRLVLSVLDHVRVSIVSDGEYVRRKLGPLLSTVVVDDNI